MRMNKTENNLKTIWKQLDNASGDLYNALDTLARMVDLSDTIKRQAEMIDITRIDLLKNEIEALIDEKKNSETKLSFDDLRKVAWKKAVVVFTKDSFEQDYTEVERSYSISSDAKYFDPMMGGNSLFGNCLDGKDNGVRLDMYMYGSNGNDGWKVDYCYITEQ